MTHVWVAAMSLLQEMEGLLKVILEDTAAKDLNARQVHVLGELYRENGQSAKNLAIAVALSADRAMGKHDFKSREIKFIIRCLLVFRLLVYLRLCMIFIVISKEIPIDEIQASLI